jgi:hypothetical protein
MGTAENFVTFLQTVTDDATTAAGAGRRERVYRTFKAVKRMALSFHDHVERFVVVVSADFTFGHWTEMFWNDATGKNE